MLESAPGRAIVLSCASVPQARDRHHNHSMSLNNRQLRYLRGLSHDLHPVVMVGDKGLSENVLGEIESALEHHELIKVRVRADRERRKEWMAHIAERCGAERVHAIGQVACYYRRNPERPVLELPA